MYGDFGDYSLNDDSFNVESNCHMISAGKEKESKKPVIISTWQSLQQMLVRKVSTQQVLFPETLELHQDDALYFEQILDDLNAAGIERISSGELGRQMGKRAIFTERVDNVMTLKRFRINPGERCIIAEDVVTTGVSSLETKRVIEENGGICVGIACVVDRTRAEAPSPIPIVASALKLDLPNYAPEECPICKEGKLPLVHLGSRKMKEAAKQTL